MPSGRRLQVVSRHLALASTAENAGVAAAQQTAVTVAAAAAAAAQPPPPAQGGIEPMTDYERFMFDLKGFVVIPNVLGPEELAAVRGHIDAYSESPQDLPESLRSPVSGAAEFLIDHPRVMGILAALITPDPARLRLESMFTSRRSIADEGGLGRPFWRPHGGGPGLRGPSFDYKTQNGRISAGMTRIVWELNEVVKGKGGTCLVPGSHKAELPFDWDNHLEAKDRLSGVPWPQQADQPDSGVWETYGCPAGSLMVSTHAHTRARAHTHMQVVKNARLAHMQVFSEAVRHTGAPWTHAANPRNAILLAYNHSTVRFHEPKACMNDNVIAALSPRRQGFFQDVWQLGNDKAARKREQRAAAAAAAVEEEH
jgi:hypothetical protein